MIEKHALYGLSCRVNAGEIARACDRVYAEGFEVSAGELSDPYIAAFLVLMDHFHSVRAEIIPEEVGFLSGAKIDFYFDDLTKKSRIRTMWDRYMARDWVKKSNLFGAEPKFESDQEFLPLQAADLWAWWVREWSETGDVSKGLSKLDFGAWNGDLRLPRSHITMDERRWVAWFAEVIASKVPEREPIFDRQTGKVIRRGANPWVSSFL